MGPYRGIILPGIVSALALLSSQDPSVAPEVALAASPGGKVAPEVASVASRKLAPVRSAKAPPHWQQAEGISSPQGNRRGNIIAL